MIITLFSSVSKAYIEDEADTTDLSWDDIAELLQDHQNVEAKEDGTLFNLALFKEIGDPTALLGRKKIWQDGQSTGEYKYLPNTVRRCRENMLAISGIILDFDKDMTIEQALERCDGMEYVLYTTFNHTAKEHRYRVVLPFTQPLLAEDIPSREASIMATFEGVDKASFSASQSFYFHAGKNDALAYKADGYMIDPYTDFEVGEVTPTLDAVKEYKSDFEITPEYKHRILSSLESCSGVRYPSGLTLVAIAKSIGLTFTEFNTLVLRIAAKDSTLIKVPGSRLDLWNTDYMKISGDKRDKFIREHSGIAKMTTKEVFGPNKNTLRMGW